MTHALIENWPIIAFILIQVAGSLKILSNMKVDNTKIQGELQLTSSQISQLKEQIIMQNGRVTRLEEKLSNHLESRK